MNLYVASRIDFFMELFLRRLVKEKPTQPNCGGGLRGAELCLLGLRQPSFWGVLVPASQLLHNQAVQHAFHRGAQSEA